MSGVQGFSDNHLRGGQMERTGLPEFLVPQSQTSVVRASEDWSELINPSCKMGTIAPCCKVVVRTK